MNLQLPESYPALLDAIKARIRVAQIKTVLAANAELIQLYWSIGCDTEVATPHLHLYREGYGDKWATRLPGDSFSNVANLWRVLQDFMRFCNIVEPPYIRRGLFT
jgi:hypothetical protein